MWALDTRGRPDTGKIELTTIQEQRIKEGNQRRWQRYREEDKPRGVLPFSEQGLENIKQGRRNAARKAVQTENQE